MSPGTLHVYAWISETLLPTIITHFPYCWSSTSFKIGFNKCSLRINCFVFCIGVIACFPQTRSKKKFNPIYFLRMQISLHWKEKPIKLKGCHVLTMGNNFYKFWLILLMVFKGKSRGVLLKIRMRKSHLTFEWNNFVSFSFLNPDSF